MGEQLAGVKHLAATSRQNGVAASGCDLPAQPLQIRLAAIVG